MTDLYSFDDSARSHRGNYRSLNEDAILSKPQAGLWVVADGMGGHEAGDVASQMIVHELDSLPAREYTSDFVDDVEQTLQDVNIKLRELADERRTGSIIGSTAVCLILRGSMGVVLWVGDSRLYRKRDDTLEPLTKDHSEVQLRIDSGLLTPEEAESSSIKNVLSRAIGAFDNLEVDVNAFPVEIGDTFVLCSDGLYNELSVGEINDTLSSLDLQDAPDKLLSDCLSKEAKDNVSFILVKVSEQE